MHPTSPRRPRSIAVGSAAARLITLTAALQRAIEEGPIETVPSLAEAKTQAVDEWIREKRADNPRCFDLRPQLTPLEQALVDFSEMQ